MRIPSVLRSGADLEMYLFSKSLCGGEKKMMSNLSKLFMFECFFRYCPTRWCLMSASDEKPVLLRFFRIDSRACLELSTKVARAAARLRHSIPNAPVPA